MKNTIFYLEGRGGMYIYHFFMYNLSSLYFIENKIYNLRGEINSSVLLNDKSKIVENPREHTKDKPNNSKRFR